MSEHFDAIIIGAGPGGEVAADRLHKGGLRVAMIEQELIGGECAYWACIPSKTLLRSTTVTSEAEHVQGISTPQKDWKQIAAYRDYMIRHLDDSKQEQAYRKQGVTIIRGHARIIGPGRIEAGGKVLETPHIVIATGSRPNIPLIEGIDTVDYWTNRQATSFSSIPESVLILGGSAQAIEFAQLMCRLGAKVTLVARGQHLMSREEPELGKRIAAQLENDGVTIHSDQNIRKISQNPDKSITAQLDQGLQIQAQHFICATGRKPNVDNLGLENVSVTVNKKGIQINEYCQAAPGIWAVGDVTGIAEFTHVAKYQARIAADNILGRTRRANYQAVPRVIFSDPEIAAVGLTTSQAHDQGIKVTTTTINFPETLARPYTYGVDIQGCLSLLADRQRGVLVGAWGIGPEAGEWIHMAAQAILTASPIHLLRDTIIQFPTFSEAYIYALEQLEV